MRRARSHFDESKVVDIVLDTYTTALQGEGIAWSTSQLKEAPLRSAQPSDAARIAQLHRDGIDTGFLPRLGTVFLTVLYHALIRWHGATVLVAGSHRPVGFIAGVENTRTFYRYFATRWGFLALIAALPRLLRPSVISQVWETMRYGQKGGVSAELLSMVVDARGSGFGHRPTPREGIHGDDGSDFSSQSQSRGRCWQSAGYRLVRSARFWQHHRGRGSFRRAIAGNGVVGLAIATAFAIAVGVVRRVTLVRATS